MRVIFTVLALGSLVLATSACSGGGTGASSAPGCTKVQPSGFPTTTQGTAVGDTAPDFHLTDKNGNDVCLRDFTGKVVLIDVAAGWCGPCKSEMGMLEDTYKQYKDQGFEIVNAMIDGYQSPSAPSQTFLQQWSQAYGLTFHVLGDPQSLTYGQYGDGYVPVQVILDKDHVIRYKQDGTWPSQSNLAGYVTTYLNQPAVLNYDTP